MCRPVAVSCAERGHTTLGAVALALLGQPEEAYSSTSRLSQPLIFLSSFVVASTCPRGRPRQRAEQTRQKVQAIPGLGIDQEGRKRMSGKRPRRLGRWRCVTPSPHQVGLGPDTSFDQLTFPVTIEVHRLVPNHVTDLRLPGKAGYDLPPPLPYITNCAIPYITTMAMVRPTAVAACRGPGGSGWRWSGTCATGRTPSSARWLCARPSRW